MSDQTTNVRAELSSDQPPGEPQADAGKTTSAEAQEKVSDAKGPVTTAGSAPKKRTRGQSLLMQFWWIPAAFLVPFLVFYQYMGTYAHIAINLAACSRSGLVGLAAAALIYGLWQIDKRIGKANKKDAHAELLVRMLGMMLWLMWVGAGHIMLVASDEVTDPSGMVYR